MVPLQIDLLCIVLKNVVYDCTLQMLLVRAGERDYSKINCHNVLLLMSYFSDFLGEDCSHIKALCVLVTELDNVFDITPDVFLRTVADDHSYSVSDLLCAWFYIHHVYHFE